MSIMSQIDAQVALVKRKAEQLSAAKRITQTVAKLAQISSTVVSTMENLQKSATQLNKPEQVSKIKKSLEKLTKATTRTTTTLIESIRRGEAT